jgi:hypothetical protein
MTGNSHMDLAGASRELGTGAPSRFHREGRQWERWN